MYEHFLRPHSQRMLNRAMVRNQDATWFQCRLKLWVLAQQEMREGLFSDHNFYYFQLKVLDFGKGAPLGLVASFDPHPMTETWPWDVIFLANLS
jgi:hypothetical protein